MHQTGSVDSLVVAVVVGLITLYVMFKVLKFAIKLAFFGAAGAAAVAAYLTYVAV